MAEQPRKIKPTGESNRGKPLRIKGSRDASKPILKKNPGVSSSAGLRNSHAPTPKLSADNEDKREGAQERENRDLGKTHDNATLLIRIKAALMTCHRIEKQKITI